VTDAAPAAVGLDELLDAAPCGFLSFADDGVVRLANAGLLEMLGYARDEVLGRHVETLFTVGTRVFYQTHLFPLLRMSGRAEEIFLLLRTRDGEQVGALANAVRRERAGAWVIDCVLMRVRERQKFEDELVRARNAAQQAHTLVQEQRDELQHANDMLEKQAMELELQHQQLQEQAAEMEAQADEMLAVNRALEERTIESERLRAEAEEANRAKSNFLAVMSHELRTPLNAIAGYVQLVEMGIHGPVTEAQLEALARVDRSQRHLLRLINDVLNLARIEAGRVEYAVEEVPLDGLMDAVLPMVEPQMAEKGLVLEARVPPGLAARADGDKVQQVLINLLSNALKFTPAGGRVFVRAEADPERGDAVRVQVRDSGIGIPPEKLAAVFEPFVQVDTGRTRRSEGSGLGLAISRDLARGMGGDLRVESTLGRGSTFTLTLPRA
jgi:PAS domain S-box-containing protein